MRSPRSRWSLAMTAYHFVFDRPAVTSSDLPKIDAHTHLFYERGFLAAFLEAHNLRVVVINITGKGFFKEPMDARWRAMRAFKAAHPERVLLCTTFDSEVAIHAEDGVEQVIQRLRTHIRQGASLVKVWKDLGLRVKDGEGRYVQVDDPRFQPIWDFLAGEGVPVMAHIAEPRAAWLPLDEASPHYRFYRDHPEHHLLGRTDVPSWETLIQARDRWVAQNPALTVIGAHLGSMAHDVAEVASRLDRYDNFYVDTAERFGDLVVQSSDRVRDFFERYADRILYGTDIIVDAPPGTPLDEEEACSSYEALLQDHEAYLSGDGSIEVQDKLLEPVTVPALDLPPEVLRKIYHDSAARLFS